MQTKHSLNWLYFFASIVIIALFVVTLFFSSDVSGKVFYKQAFPVTTQTVENFINETLIASYEKINTKIEEKNVKTPIRLRIPQIKVDAHLESVGLTSNGAVGVPQMPMNAAWFNLSTIPGEQGSSIIAGHFGQWKNGNKSVFDNLHTLKKGDKIYVENTQGTTTTFVVRESKSYNPDAYAVEVFTSYDQKSHLNLITCEGSWNQALSSYSQRLVIFSDKEE